MQAAAPASKPLNLDLSRVTHPHLRFCHRPLPSVNEADFFATAQHAMQRRRVVLEPGQSRNLSHNITGKGRRSIFEQLIRLEANLLVLPCFRLSRCRTLFGPDSLIRPWSSRLVKQPLLPHIANRTEFLHTIVISGF